MAGVPVELKGRSFTRIAGWSREELATLLGLADELKAERARRRELRVLPGRTLALIFYKPSTRTRVSSEVAIAELGGMALYVPAADLQLSRGESTRDTALVLSRMVSAILIRTFEQEEVEEFAEHASIPVINGLTDETHPLQAVADTMTLRERFGDLSGLRIAYVGDGNNVCHSLMRIAARFGMEFVAATPPGYEPNAEFVTAAVDDARASGGSVALVADPHEAVRGAHALYTDVWVSMGQEAERVQRLEAFGRYQINETVMGFAKPSAVLMHCLPAHRGEEITDAVLDGPRSIVLDQAENRLHAQKAVIFELLGGSLDDA
jgi:ornithine carbamoyltransferase